MNKTSVISLKVDNKLKEEVTAIADDLGIPLATYLKMCLKKLRNERSISFQRLEVPSPSTEVLWEKQTKDIEDDINIIDGGDSVESLRKALLSE